MLLDGKTCSLAIKDTIKANVELVNKKYQIVPTLAIIQVGDNSASNIYIKNKIKAAEYVGIRIKHQRLLENVTMEELKKIILALNNDNEIDGIIVQLPLPKHLNEEIVINTIDPAKDVDGFGILNKGKLFVGLDCLPPATPYGIMKMLEIYQIELTAKNVVVVGRSNIVGKPMAMMLLNKNATVTICHSKTQNLVEICKKADVLVVAIGKAKFIDAKMVKQGAVVIDVGMNKDENNKLCGDVDFEDVKDKVSYITPVPGGVGPLTIASLLENTYKACIKRRGIEQC